MFHNQTDPDKQYLEDQLEQYKEAERQRNEEAAEKRAQQEKERQQYLYAEYRTAETWPEALQKQASLMAREANYEAGENFRPGTYFTDSVEACERGLEIWREVEETKQAQTKELQRQLEAARDEIRFAVARQLASESDKIGWQGVASSIEEDTLEGWLDW